MSREEERAKAKLSHCLWHPTGNANAPADPKKRCPICTAVKIKCDPVKKCVIEEWVEQVPNEPGESGKTYQMMGLIHHPKSEDFDDWERKCQEYWARP